MNIELLKRTPDLRGMADIRLMILEDGPGRGQRLLVARNAAGIGFEVSVDRGFDVSALSFRGTNLGWHSVNQMRFPTVDPHSERDLGFYRNFDGFLVTCGLDHYSGPKDVDVTHYGHPQIASKTMPQHGRISGERARLLSYGVDPETGEIHCEGIVRQASVFGESLELRRRISLKLAGPELVISDSVTNRGFKPSRHAMLYHFNIGYPFLDRDIEISGLPTGLSDDLAHDPPIAGDDYGQRVDLLDSGNLSSPGRIRVASRAMDMALEMTFDPDALPKFAVWRAYQSGIFALGLEPRTLGPDLGPLLAPGERRDYAMQLKLAAPSASRAVLQSGIVR